MVNKGKWKVFGTSLVREFNDEDEANNFKEFCEIKERNNSKILRDLNECSFKVVKCKD